MSHSHAAELLTLSYGKTVFFLLLLCYFSLFSDYWVHLHAGGFSIANRRRLILLKAKLRYFSIFSITNAFFVCFFSVSHSYFPCVLSSGKKTSHKHLFPRI